MSVIWTLFFGAIPYNTQAQNTFKYRVYDRTIVNSIRQTSRNRLGYLSTVPNDEHGSTNMLVLKCI